MTTVPVAEPPPREGPGRRLSTFLFRHPRIRLGVLLALPLGWLVVVYFGSLFVLLLSSFWDTDPFTRDVVHDFTLENFRRIIETPVFRDVAWRTIQMAALVTVADVILAFPIAYYMARVASPRTRDLLVIAVLMPLWANYLVKAYAWRTILSDGGKGQWEDDARERRYRSSTKIRRGFEQRVGNPLEPCVDRQDHERQPEIREDEPQADGRQAVEVEAQRPDGPVDDPTVGEDR